MAQLIIYVILLCVSSVEKRKERRAAALEKLIHKCSGMSLVAG